MTRRERIAELREALHRYAKDNMRLSFRERLNLRRAIRKNPGEIEDLLDTINEEAMAQGPIQDFFQWILDNADEIIDFIRRIIDLFLGLFPAQAS